MTYWCRECCWHAHNHRKRRHFLFCSSSYSSLPPRTEEGKNNYYIYTKHISVKLPSIICFHFYTKLLLKNMSKLKKLAGMISLVQTFNLHSVNVKKHLFNDASHVVQGFIFYHDCDYWFSIKRTHRHIISLHPDMSIIAYSSKCHYNLWHWM